MSKIKSEDLETVGGGWRGGYGWSEWGGGPPYRGFYGGPPRGIYGGPPRGIYGGGYYPGPSPYALERFARRQAWARFNGYGWDY